MRRLLNDIRRGGGYLPEFGHHPGTVFAIGLTLVTAIAGLERSIGTGVIGLVLGAALYGSMWAYGAASRARDHDRLMERREAKS